MLVHSFIKDGVHHNRPQSVLARFDNNQLPPTIENLLEHPKSSLAIDEMGDRRESGRRDWDRENDSLSQNTDKTTLTKIKPSSTKYQSVLEYNDVKIDRTGLKMSTAVRKLVETSILKQRTSPPLSQDLLNSTVTSMN